MLRLCKHTEDLFPGKSLMELLYLPTETAAKFFNIVLNYTDKQPNQNQEANQTEL